MNDILFYFFAIGLLTTSFLAIVVKNPVHSVLSVVSSFFFLASLYLTLSMQFLAVIQIMVYAGAVMVLFIFIVMLFDLQKSEYRKDKLKWYDFLSIGVVVLSVIGSVIAIINSKAVNSYTKMANVPSDFGSVSKVSYNLFGNSTQMGPHTFVFEIISILLLAAIVASVVVAKKKL